MEVVGRIYQNLCFLNQTAVVLTIPFMFQCQHSVIMEVAEYIHPFLYTQSRIWAFTPILPLGACVSLQPPCKDPNCIQHTILKSNMEGGTTGSGFPGWGGFLGPVHALAPGKWPFSPIIPSLQITDNTAHKNNLIRKRLIVTRGLIKGVI